MYAGMGMNTGTRRGATRADWMAREALAASIEDTLERQLAALRMIDPYGGLDGRVNEQLRHTRADRRQARKQAERRPA